MLKLKTTASRRLRGKQQKEASGRGWRVGVAAELQHSRDLREDRALSSSLLLWARCAAGSPPALGEELPPESPLWPHAVLQVGA